MAEGGVRSGVEQSCREVPLDAEVGVADRVHAGVDLDEAARGDPAGDGAPVKAAIEELSPADHPPLELRHARDANCRV
jgi:hypothetical protein